MNHESITVGGREGARSKKKGVMNMKAVREKLPRAVAAVTLTFLAASNAFAGAGETDHDQDLRGDLSFSGILGHYEEIRQTLLADGTEGLAAHAKAIADTAEALSQDFSAEKAGVHLDQAAAARQILPEMSQAATRLAEASDLGAAREALYPLSKALVRFRKLATGDLPAVAYCPMVKKSWLQPGGEIGNPYFGQAMPTCGEIVDG